MRLYIGIVLLLPWCAIAQYEHVVHDDDNLILTSDDSDGGDSGRDSGSDSDSGSVLKTSKKNHNSTGFNENTVQESNEENEASNVFLRGTPSGLVAEDDRNRYRSTPSPPPFRETIFNFGSYANKLPSVPRARHPGRYHHKNRWINFKGYSESGDKYQKKGGRMKSKNMTKNSSKHSRKRFTPSHKPKKHKKRHSLYWWEKRGDKGEGELAGKGNPSRGNWKAKGTWKGNGKGTWPSKGKGSWKGKGKGTWKGKGRVTDLPTFAPTEMPTAMPSVSLSPAFTAPPTNFPTSAALVYISVTGEDRTIQLQGNGGAEGAPNPRLKVDREGSEQDQVVIKFTDLDNIPTGATIVSAFLTVEVTLETQRTINWHRLLVPWEESTVNGRYFGTGIPPINSEFLVQPDGSEAVAAPSASFIGRSDVTIDLTDDIQFWIDNPGTNNGWVIIADENDPGSFSEWGIWGLDSTNNAPTLVITYIPP